MAVIQAMQPRASSGASGVGVRVVETHTGALCRCMKFATLLSEVRAREHASHIYLQPAAS